MLALLIFAALLGGVMFLVHPNPILCSTTLSSGLLSGQPHWWFAFALVPLFFALRGRYAGFVLLAPSIVSVAMTPEGATAVLISAVVLLARRFRAWLVFVSIAASILLIALIGFPLASIVILALLLALSEEISDLRWRVRAIVLWLPASIVTVALLARYVGSFDLSIVGYTPALPIAAVLFVALSVQALLVLDRDRNAAVFRSLVLLVGSIFVVPLSTFAMPIVVGVLASRLEVAIGPERLRGARLVAIVIIIAALVPHLFVHASVPQVDHAVVLAPSYFELACQGHAYPARLDRSGELRTLSNIRDPGVLSQALYERNVTTVVYPANFSAPIAYGVARNVDFSVQHRDGLVIASLP